MSGPFPLGRDDEGEYSVQSINKCHADLQPRFYLIRWGGVSPTVEYTAYIFIGDTIINSVCELYGGTMNMLTDACKEASVKRVKFTIHSGQRETIQTDLLFFFFCS